MDIKIVLWPQGDVNLTRIPPLELISLLQLQAKVPPNREDELRLHYRSDFIVGSTPHEDRAQRYALHYAKHRRQDLCPGRACATPTNICAGVISGLPLYLPLEDVVQTLIEHNRHLQLPLMERGRLTGSVIRW